LRIAESAKTFSKHFNMSVSKKIVLGVTGSIAAHKAADLASLLTKQKCDVRVVMTADAQRFITPLPFKTLTRHPVVTDLYDEDEGWKPTHIEMADAADCCSSRRRRRT
jgi:phosphopantothenoylcysteine decarboxylase